MTYNDREYRIKLLDRKIKEAEDQLQLDQAEYKKLLQEKNKQFDDVFSKKYNIDCTNIHKLIHLAVKPRLLGRGYKAV